MAGKTSVVCKRRTRRSITDRQRVVLNQLLGGGSERAIARELGVSYHTVHAHAKAIYRSYGVHSRPELMSKILVGRSSKS